MELGQGLVRLWDKVSRFFEENDITGFSSNQPILQMIKAYNASEHFLSAEEPHSLPGATLVLVRGNSGLPYVVSHRASPELII